MKRRNLLAALLLTFYGGIYLMSNKEKDKDEKEPKPVAAQDENEPQNGPQEDPPPADPGNLPEPPK